MEQNKHLRYGTGFLKTDYVFLAGLRQMLTLASLSREMETISSLLEFTLMTFSW